MKEKIITIIPSLYNGGAEKFTADLSYSLSEKYDHLMVAYNREDRMYPHQGELLALDVPEKRNLFARLRRQLSILKKIKALMRSVQPKVTISHMLMANMLNLLSNKKGKTICVLHGEWSVKSGHSKLIDRFIRRVYKKSDLIISVSHYIKNMFDDYHKLDVPHEVVYVGSDIQQTKKKSEEPISLDLPENYLVYVAGFRPVKNHLKLLDQLESFLKNNEISLVLVGDGPLRPQIEGSIKAKGLDSKVLLLGNLSNPYPIVKNAKVSLVVSSSESFSLVVVESMALGVPVIATDCGGPREIIVPDWRTEIELPHTGEYGILIPKTEKWTQHTLVTEIEMLIKDKDLWSHISANGKNRAEHFDIKNSELQYEAIIDKLLTSAD